MCGAWWTPGAAKARPRPGIVCPHGGSPWAASGAAGPHFMHKNFQNFFQKFLTNLIFGHFQDYKMTHNLRNEFFFKGAKPTKY